MAGADLYYADLYHIENADGFWEKGINRSLYENRLLDLENRTTG